MDDFEEAGGLDHLSQVFGSENGDATDIEVPSIAVMSGKGGVGKTTTTLNLSAAVAELGTKSVILDMDLETSNLTLELGYRSGGETNVQELLESGIDNDMMATISRVRRRLGLLPSALTREEMEWEHDHLSDLLGKMDRWSFVDTPPGINEDQVKIMQAVENVIIVMTPSESSFVDGMKMVSLARQCDAEVLGVIINRAGESRYDLSVEDMKDSLSDVGVLGVVPEDKRVRKTKQENAPIVDFHPNCPAAISYMKIASRLTGEDYRRPHAIKRFFGRVRP